MADPRLRSMHISIPGLGCILEAALLLDAKLHCAGVTMHVFDYTCIGPYKFSIILSFADTCIGPDMYLNVHVC
jgi:hypothetical protein